MLALEGLDEIQSCLDVTDAHIARAMAPAESLDAPSPRRKMLALAERMAEVGAPGTGAPRLLLVAARMALRDWIEGDLVVRLIGDEDLTVVQLMVDDGVSMERITAPLQITAPLSEFRAAIESNPNTVLPLQLEGDFESRGFTLRGKRQTGPRRAPSYSALAIDLVKGISGGQVEVTSRPPPRKPAGAGAPKSRNLPPPRKQPPASKPGPPPPPSSKRLASYAKLPAIIEFPDDPKKKS